MQADERPRTQTRSSLVTHKILYAFQDASVELQRKLEWQWQMKTVLLFDGNPPRLNHCYSCSIDISHLLYSIAFYYMDRRVLLKTKTLVESINHYIRDPSDVFSVCHSRE